MTLTAILVFALATLLAGWLLPSRWRVWFLLAASILAAYWLLKGPGLSNLLLLGDASFFAKVVVLGFLASIVMFPFTPLFSWMSRKDERESDRFASELTGDPASMASALIKLSKENLSNLHPHPLYAAFYYSHPPVVERIRSLKSETSVSR